eukprot:1554828-Rhodomonas_salina.1
MSTETTRSTPRYRSCIPGYYEPILIMHIIHTGYISQPEVPEESWDLSLTAILDTLDTNTR